MQRWEYLEVEVNYFYGWWRDSLGRRGKLVDSEEADPNQPFSHSGPLLNELGEQGWELIGIQVLPHGGTFRTYDARWVFKRPGTSG